MIEKLNVNKDKDSFLKALELSEVEIYYPLKNKLSYITFLKDYRKLRHKIFVYTYKIDNKFAGYLIIIKDFNRYKKSFIVYHPIVSFYLILKRYSLRIKVKSSSYNQIWSESNETIAKVINIHVFEEFRGLGIANMLYENAFKDLKSMGVKRLDASLNINNNSSLRLHKKSGFLEVGKTDSKYYFSKLIN
ncbi:MAG: GNAT family N-acetyltransferase [Ignavibacteria bacterium]|nr:GNAT family N-acetyltransferase [Ignavibacteria bacterium]HCN38530.1 hypothetical protein [Bacteroidota bacterium]